MFIQNTDTFTYKRDSRPCSFSCSILARRTFGSALIDTIEYEVKEAYLFVSTSLFEYCAKYLVNLIFGHLANALHYPSRPLLLLPSPYRLLTASVGFYPGWCELTINSPSCSDARRILVADSLWMFPKFHLYFSSSVCLVTRASLTDSKLHVYPRRSLSKLPGCTASMKFVILYFWFAFSNTCDSRCFLWNDLKSLVLYDK